jgi:hypothetical protein
MQIHQRIALVAMFVAGSAVSAFGDGCFVWRRGADLNEPSQKAIICKQGNTETLILQVKYEGLAENFAWIVPLPARPEVTAINAYDSPFGEISLYTQRRSRWGYRGRMDKRGGAEKGAVKVLEQKIVGVYEIAVLAAEDAGALTKWLNKNGYAFPEKRKDVLEHYTKKDWVYVAMRIDRKALKKDEVKKLKTGELQPIRFTFKTEEIVYPLKISSINAGETKVLLYVLADEPMHVKNDGKRPGFSIARNMSLFSQYRDVRYGTWRKAIGIELPLTWKALQLPADACLSLCTYRETYKTEDMGDDLRFTTFNAEAYWRKRLKGAATDKDPRSRQQILSILAYYDADIMRTLAQEDNTRLRALAGMALNPRSPVDVLRKLARDEHVDVRRSVAGNTSIPADILSELAKDKDPSVRESIARNPKTPTTTLRQLIKEPNMIAQVARNGGLSVDMLGSLAASEDAYVREMVARNPTTPEDILWLLAVDEVQSVKVSILSLPSRSLKVLTLLAEDADPAVRIHLAYSERLPVEIMSKLLSDADPAVRIAIGHNTHLWNRSRWQDVSERLVNDKDSQVRVVAAANPYIGSDALRKLASDKSNSVRLAVADNRATPPKILARLAKDKNVEIRRSVSWKSTTPHSSLRRLASDEDEEVRRRVLLNIQTPSSVLDRMARDASEYIRINLVWRDKTSAKALSVLARDPSVKVRRPVAGHPKLPINMLAQLANDESELVRKQVCENTNVTAEILIKLADDKVFDVRWAVVRQSKAPAEALRLIVQNAESMKLGLGPGIAAHPNAPEDVLEKLVQHQGFNSRRAVAARLNVPIHILKQLSQDDQSGVRYTIASNITAPHEILDELSRDGHVDVRHGVAQNLTTPQEILKRLAQDKDTRVSDSAETTLEKQRQRLWLTPK